MQIIVEVIKEPIGGAHRNKEQIILSTKDILSGYLGEFKKKTREEIFEQRKEKFLNIGKQKFFSFYSDKTWIRKDNLLSDTKKILFKFKRELIILILIMFSIFLFL